MKQLTTLLFAFCTLGLSAQTGAVSPPAKGKKTGCSTRAMGSIAHGPGMRSMKIFTRMM
ncbi:MAG: hypothetical protein H6591_02630 [Flavobacteriales bacterium]|nr:hypothetical protein [Flavobacteriales bacterium]